jgi:hypothetical protein
MIHTSLKYIHLLHVSTTQGHLRVTLYFHGIYRTANILTRTPKYVIVYLQSTENTETTQDTHDQEAVHQWCTEQPQYKK